MAMEMSSVGAAAHCAGPPQSSHPRAQEGCSYQPSRLALCYGTAGTGTEQSQHAATLSHSSSSNTLTSWLVMWYLFREGVGKELSDNHSGKNIKTFTNKFTAGTQKPPDLYFSDDMWQGHKWLQWRITIRYTHEYSSKLRIYIDTASPAGNAAN